MWTRLWGPVRWLWPDITGLCLTYKVLQASLSAVGGTEQRCRHDPTAERPPFQDGSSPSSHPMAWSSRASEDPHEECGLRVDGVGRIVVDRQSHVEH